MEDRDKSVGHGKPIEKYEVVQTEISPVYDSLR